MEKYEKVLKNEIFFNVIEWVILCIMVIFSIIAVVKFFSYLDIVFKKQILYTLGAIFLIAITITKTYEISKPLIDVKENSFITYTGNVVYYYDKSNKYTDILQLIDNCDVFVEAPSGTVNSSKNRCKARVVYGKHSNKVVEFTEIE